MPLVPWQGGGSERCMVIRDTRVIIYGSSLNTAGIAASLKSEAGLEVLCCSPRSPTAVQSLNDSAPTAIVFELSEAPIDLGFTLLNELPRLLLIGVDAYSDKILLLSGNLIEARSAADLVKIIRQQNPLS